MTKATKASAAKKATRASKAKKVLPVSQANRAIVASPARTASKARAGLKDKDTLYMMIVGTILTIVFFGAILLYWRV